MTKFEAKVKMCKKEQQDAYQRDQRIWKEARHSISLYWREQRMWKPVRKICQTEQPISNEFSKVYHVSWI